VTEEGSKALEVCERSNGKPAHTTARCSSAVSEALESESRLEAKRQWRREARRGGRRPGTVLARWRDGRRLPDLRMTGQWLEEVGFGLGQELEVELKAGGLTIQAV
jgi:hypothetical protein